MFDQRRPYRKTGYLEYLEQVILRQRAADEILWTLARPWKMTLSSADVAILFSNRRDIMERLCTLFAASDS